MKVNNEEVNPKLKKYYKYASEQPMCIYGTDNCCVHTACTKPKSCCRIWTYKNISQYYINYIKRSFEEDYNNELFIDFIEEFCNIEQ
jgi:hypothetical protein